MDIYMWLEFVALTAGIVLMPIVIIELNKKDVEK